MCQVPQGLVFGQGHHHQPEARLQALLHRQHNAHRGRHQHRRLQWCAYVAFQSVGGRDLCWLGVGGGVGGGTTRAAHMAGCTSGPLPAACACTSCKVLPTCMSADRAHARACRAKRTLGCVRTYIHPSASPGLPCLHLLHHPTADPLHVWLGQDRLDYDRVRCVRPACFLWTPTPPHTHLAELQSARPDSAASLGPSARQASGRPAETRPSLSPTASHAAPRKDRPRARTALTTASSCQGGGSAGASPDGDAPSLQREGGPSAADACME